MLLQSIEYYRRQRKNFKEKLKDLKGERLQRELDRKREREKRKRESERNRRKKQTDTEEKERQTELTGLMILRQTRLPERQNQYRERERERAIRTRNIEPKYFEEDVLEGIRRRQNNFTEKIEKEGEQKNFTEKKVKDSNQNQKYKGKIV